jgi:hypothetical protein
VVLCHLGVLNAAEEVRRLARQVVVSIGSIDLLITLAQVNAQILSLRGRASLRAQAGEHASDQPPDPLVAKDAG